MRAGLELAYGDTAFSVAFARLSLRRLPHRQTKTSQTQVSRGTLVEQPSPESVHKHHTELGGTWEWHGPATLRVQHPFGAKASASPNFVSSTYPMRALRGLT